MLENGMQNLHEFTLGNDDINMMGHLSDSRVSVIRLSVIRSIIKEKLISEISENLRFEPVFSGIPLANKKSNA
jgi:hypothetical protein